MTAIRTGAYVFAIIALVVLAGWGVFQVINAQDSTEPIRVTSEEAAAEFDEAVSKARLAVEEFVRSGADLCTLPLADSAGQSSRPYEDLPSLVNDVDLVAEANLLTTSVAMPRPGTAAGRVTTEFSLRNVLHGKEPGESLVLETGGRVTQDGGSLVRTNAGNFDACAIDHALLFLNQSEDEGVYALANQGFATFSDSLVDISRSSDLFADAGRTDSLITSVRQISDSQAADNLERGRLVCESRRNSELELDPKACPGDSVNVYAAFGLARVLEANIRKVTVGEGERIVSTAEFGPDSPALKEFLSLLDRTVAVTSAAAAPSDSVSITVITTTTGTEPYGALLKYNESEDVIFLPASGGKFGAPEGFGAALNALLQGS